MQQAILSMINLHNGIREVDLALLLLELILPQNFDSEEYHKIIKELISSGKIKKIEYIEPARTHIHTDMAIKSIFFTGETEFLVNSTGAFSDKMVEKSRGDT